MAFATIAETVKARSEAVRDMIDGLTDAHTTLLTWNSSNEFAVAARAPLVAGSHSLPIRRINASVRVLSPPLQIPGAPGQVVVDIIFHKTPEDHPSTIA